MGRRASRGGALGRRAVPTTRTTWNSGSKSAPPSPSGRGTQISGLPEGIDTLEVCWQAFSAADQPALIPSTTHHSAATRKSTRVRQWLELAAVVLANPRPTSADEAAGFLGAVVQACDEELRETVHARAVVVNTSAMWRAVTGGGACRIVVTEPAPNWPVIARQRSGVGTTSRCFYGNDSTVRVDIDLPPLRVLGRAGRVARDGRRMGSVLRLGPRVEVPHPRASGADGGRCRASVVGRSGTPPCNSCRSCSRGRGPTTTRTRMWSRGSAGRLAPRWTSA